MNAPKVTDLDYINFLVAAPRVVSCTEAARVQPDGPRRAAHDALTRLLRRLEPDTTPLWREAEQHVDRHTGLLIVDDTTLDKPYAQQIELVHRHWSGKHHRVVKGINLVTLLWSDGPDAIPCDYRLFDKPVDGITKNAHFRAMLDTAKTRGFQPRLVAFDGWYSGLANLKAIRTHTWQWLTRLKANRQVNPDGTGNRALSDCAIREAGTRVHLKGYGFILVFRIDTPDGDTEYWATSDLTLTMDERTELADQVWTIET
jgi:putative transposase